MADNNDRTPDEVIDDTTDENLSYRYSITSYGADYTVQVLVSKLDNEVVLKGFII